MFTGPDGVEYRWALGAMRMSYPKVNLFSALPASSLNHDVKLVTTDEEKTVIAEYHRARKKQKARFKVHPAGMGMLDSIVLTFVFVEKNRRERETTTKSTFSGLGSFFFLFYHYAIRQENEG